MRVYKFLDAHFGMKSLKEKRLKISTLEDLNDPFELLPFVMIDRVVREDINSMRQLFGKRWGILCFSSDWRDPVVWAHYADKHRGLCLVFEIPEAEATRVSYVSKRLPFEKGHELPPLWFYMKYKNWSYEKEVRRFLRLGNKSEGLHFIRFGKSLQLVKVIVGARCSLSKHAIVAALRPMSSVEVIKVWPAPEIFK